MNYFPGRRCDPELAAPANRRALTTDDLTQMVDDAAEYAGQANASATRAEQVVEGVDASIIVVDAAVARAETYAQSAQEAQEGASASSATATEQAGNAVLSAASAADSAASVNKGQPNGTAPLDASAKLPEANVPTRLTPAAISATIATSLPSRPLESFVANGESLVLDGVGYGDNSAILQRAIDQQAASSVFSWAVVIPIGALRLKTSGTVNGAKYGVRVKNRSRIIGADMVSSKIISDTDSTPIFAAYGGTLTDVEIGNLTIECTSQYQEKNGAPEYTTQLKAMFMQDIIRPRFHDLIIRDSWGTSIGCDALVDYAMSNILIYTPGRGIGVSGIDPFLASGGSGVGIGTGKYRDEAGTISGLVVHGAGRVALFYEKQTQYTNLSRGHVARNVVSVGSWAALHDCGCDGLDAEVTSIGDQHGLLLDGTYLEPHAGINGDVKINVDGATKAGVLLGAMPEGKYKISGQVIRSKAGVLSKTGAKIGPNVQLRVDTRENQGAGVYVASSTFPVKALTVTGRHENNGQDTSSTQRSGVIIDVATDMLDINVVARDTQDARTQRYGVELRGTDTASMAGIRGDARGNAVGGFLSTQTITGDSVISLVGATTTGPSRLSATPDGSGALALTWDAPFPANDVTDYRIEYRQGTAGSWTAWTRTASTSTSDRITGLTNRQPYQVRVADVRGSTVGAFTAGPVTATPMVAAIITDSFVRANSASTLGSTEGGTLGPLAYQYTPNTTWKIQSNFARPASGGLSVARVNTGLTSYSYEMVVGDLNATSGTRQADVIFRYVDDANYWMVTPRINSSLPVWGVQKRVSGSNQIVATYSDTSIGNGDKVRVDVTPTTVSVYINGLLKGNYTDSTHSTGTWVGMRGLFTSDSVSKFGTGVATNPGLVVYPG